MSELFISLLGLSKERLFVDPKHLSTLHRCGKLQDLLATAEDSEAGEVREMKMISPATDCPKKYVGLGTELIEERRKVKRDKRNDG